MLDFSLNRNVLAPWLSHGEIDDIYRLVANPPFAETRSTGYDSGLPRSRKKSFDILQSRWGDVQSAKVFLVDSDKVPLAGRTEPCPTHTVLKRNHDRSWSSEFRTISDMRRIDRLVGNRDVSPVCVPGIGDLLKRIAELTVRYPIFKVWLAKTGFPQRIQTSVGPPGLPPGVSAPVCGRRFGDYRELRSIVSSSAIRLP